MGRVSVGVRCHGNKHSTRYITAHVGVTGTYVQLATGVAAGTLISADMLELRQGDLSSLPQHTILLADAAIGQISARQLNAGTVLRKQDLRTRPLVRRGQEVSIETRGPGFVVSRSGEAMQAGGLGDTVRVRLSRQETVTTVVSGEGRVRIR